MEPMELLPGRGVRFSQRNITVDFDTSVQDLLSDVGQPTTIFFHRNKCNFLPAQGHSSEDSAAARSRASSAASISDASHSVSSSPHFQPGLPVFTASDEEETLCGA